MAGNHKWKAGSGWKLGLSDENFKIQKLKDNVDFYNTIWNTGRTLFSFKYLNLPCTTDE